MRDLKTLLNLAVYLFFWARILAYPSVIAAETTEIPVGKQLRDTTLWGLDGETSTFSLYRGKPLIINVWASWCGPCVAEMASLNQLSQNFNGKQFNIIGISTDDDPKAAIARLEKSKITFQNFLDSNLVLENMLGADRIPLTLLVDTNGIILEKIHGARDWISPDSLKRIESQFQVNLSK